MQNLVKSTCQESKAYQRKLKISNGSPLVSVILLNWNGRKYLKDCLDSLINQIFQDFEIIIIDNGSRDGSCELIREKYCDFRLIINNCNKGFAIGNNQGIKIAKGKYIALLNNDAEADPYWLLELVKKAEEDPSIGMVVSKIYLKGNNKVLDNVGHLIYPDGLNRGHGRLEKDYGQYDKEEEALFPSGCAALYRKEMLDEIGLFDEDFFAYGDDTDIGLKGRLAGWKCIYAPRAVVYHKYSQSTGAYSPLKAFYVERNRIWIVIKYFPLSKLLLSPIFTFLRLALQAYGALVGQGAAGKFRKEYSALLLLRIFFKAQVSALKGLPKMLRKRKEIKKITRLSSKEIKTLLNRFRMTTKEIALKD